MQSVDRLPSAQRATRDPDASEASVPGRTTQSEHDAGEHEADAHEADEESQAKPALHAGASVFAGGALPWDASAPASSPEAGVVSPEDDAMSADDGAQMIAAIQPAPIESQERESEEAFDDESAGVGVDVEARARTAGRDDRDDDRDVSAARAAKRGGKKLPSSPYATAHNKNMKNYTFAKGVTDPKISNSAEKTFDSPNQEDLGALAKDITRLETRLRNAKTAKQRKRIKQELRALRYTRRFEARALNTISVDIGTVVGGKPGKDGERGDYREAWVLVFHYTNFFRGGERYRIYSNDHTGWIKVSQLEPKGQAQIAAYQDKLRQELVRGKGSGHQAPLERGAKAIALDVKNPETLEGDDDIFRIQGGSATTPLRNYTVNEARYGNIVVGVWNPPGAAENGERFGGSGGIRAFIPNDSKKRLRLCDVAPMNISDRAGKGNATWRYVRANVANDTVHCWVLQRWTTPDGKKGQNFSE